MASVETRSLNLTDEQIEQNKERFLSLLDFPNHPECDVEKVKKFLLNSDFFVAPSSTVYHGCCKGGLCYHSLSVYETLCKYVKMVYPDQMDTETGELKSTSPYSDETLRLVALFHDISKVNCYKEDYRNVKKYCENGKAYDVLGHYNWEPEKYYKYKEAEERWTFGTHTETSLFITMKLIPDISKPEAEAILHHMGSTIDWNGKDIAPETYNKNPLALLLHQADEFSALYLERV